MITFEVNMILECTHSVYNNVFTVGKKYPVRVDCIESNNGWKYANYEINDMIEQGELSFKVVTKQHSLEEEK